jgi:hypothetical protein
MTPRHRWRWAIDDTGYSRTAGPWAATTAAAWISAEIGVEPAIASGSQACSGRAWPAIHRDSGTVTSCQVGVSLSVLSDTASCPVDRRLFVAESWDPASSKACGQVDWRRRKAGIGDEIGQREKATIHRKGA